RSWRSTPVLYNATADGPTPAPATTRATLACGTSRAASACGTTRAASAMRQDTGSVGLRQDPGRPGPNTNTYRNRNGKSSGKKTRTERCRRAGASHLLRPPGAHHATERIAPGMLRELWDLFVAFTRAGLFGYGGGPGSIPLIKREVVDIYHWMTDEQFAEALAFGNALPGPIATKLATYVGFHVAGTPGAVAGVAGIVLPTAAA